MLANECRGHDLLPGQPGIPSRISSAGTPLLGNYFPVLIASFGISTVHQRLFHGGGQMTRNMMFTRIFRRETEAKSGVF
jgi:hypothetical protein